MMKKRMVACLFITFYIIYYNKTHIDISMSQIPLMTFIAEFLRATLELIKSERNIEKEEPSHEIRKFAPELPIYAFKINQEGFDFEEHKIVTEDGYVLTTWRIPGKITESRGERELRRPVMLQHGLFDTSYTWLMLKEGSLALTLAKEGYDVWMSNSRGNFFSNGHLNKEYDSSKFYSDYWDFTFHEMAIFDLPANVFYIKNITKFNKILYVGHSQGTIQYFIKYSLDPSFIEENIEKFVSLGTVANVFNTTSKIVHLLDFTGAMILMEKIKVKNILTMYHFLYDFINVACKNLSFVCKSILQYFIEDLPTDKIDFSQFFDNFYFAPGGTSARNVNHWIQVFSTKRFGYFDHGSEGNFLKYGQATPPLYDVEKFKHYRVKSLITVSDSDPFSKKEDCQQILKLIDEEFVTLKELKNYNHMDYLWSKNATLDIYDEIVGFLK